MRPLLLGIALVLAPAMASAAERPDKLREEIEKLKQQVAQLSKGENAAQAKLGTVNIVRVFDELEEKIDMNAELRQFNDKRGARLKELGERARDLTEKAKLLNPETEEAKKTAKSLEEAKSEFRSYRDTTDEHLHKKLFDFTRAIYNKIRDEVQAYAREGGYDLILRTRDPEIGDVDETLPYRTRYLELNRRIEAQTVFFHRSSFDLTDAIIKRLNEKYLREKAEKRELRTPDSTPPKAKE